jgi:antitoxin (DNA-binding transcriptional repressor) of toxin-antitoxin stability system
MSIIQVNMHEAKSQLSQLTERVLLGDKVIIARAGKPCVELLPHVQAQPVRQAGRLKGKIVIPDDFDSTSNDIIDGFYGSQL